MATKINFSVGEKFKSFKEFMDKLTSYQESNFVQLYKRSSVKIGNSKAYKSKKFKEVTNEELVYQELKYTCIHGGRTFSSKSEGTRPNQSTFQMKCPMALRLLCKDGNTLEVFTFTDEHNHETTEASYKHLFHQRKLETDIKHDVKQLLKMKSNKRLVQDHIGEKTGQVVTLKDLHNIAGNKRTADLDSNTDFDALLKRMKEVNGATVEVMANESGTVKGIFFQDECMRKMFERFPEVLLIDATYKLNELRLPLFVLMSVDGNGEGEVISLWIVTDESRDMIKEMIRIFKRTNENWSNIKCVMSDKDMNERDVIREEIPNVPLLICLFHVLRTFKREVTTDKLGLSKDERILSLELLQKLAYARSEDSYNELYNELKDTKLESVIRYFDKNWHPIRQEWVEGLKNNSTHLMNSTNNRVESINQKLKGVITKFSNIVAFFDGLMKTMKSFRIERNHRALKMFQKVPVNRFETGHPLSDYVSQVTPYAFRFIAQQMEASSKIYESVTISPDAIAVSLSSSDGPIVVTATTCECSFFKCMSLPCKHIFCFRKKASLSLFEPELVAFRWTKSYYRKNHVAFTETEGNAVEPTEPTISVTTTPRRRRVRALSGQDKYRRVLTVTKQLAELVSEMPMRMFNSEVQKLEDIVDILKSGSQYSVQKLDTEQSVEYTNERHLETIPEAVMNATHSCAINQLQSENTPVDVANTAENALGNYEDQIAELEIEAANDVNLETLLMEENRLMEVSTSNTNSIESHAESVYEILEVMSDVQQTETVKVPNVVMPTIPVVLDEEPLIDTSDDGRAATASPDEISLVPVNEPKLKLPTKMIRRGRPKGAETTVIGLTRRTKHLLPYLKRQPKEKEEAILGWILKTGVNITSVMDGAITVSEVSLKSTENMPTKVLDENINLGRIKRNLTDGAWKTLKQNISTKKEIAEWNCLVCDVDVHIYESIVCDGCLEWYHLKCVGLKNPPKTIYWMCRKCHQK